MTLLRVTVQELDDEGREIDGHNAFSVLSQDQLQDQEIVDWLIRLAKTGELNKTPSTIKPSVTSKSQNTIFSSS